MSADTQIRSLLQAIADQIRLLRADLTGSATGQSAALLETTATDVVSAVNEINALLRPPQEIVSSSPHVVASSPATLLLDLDAVGGACSITLPAQATGSIIVTSGSPETAPITIGSASNKFNGAAGPLVVSSAVSRIDIAFINPTYGHHVALVPNL